MVFGISDKDFFDKNKIKVIDSIAGAGKSSLVDAEFRKHGIAYARYTSTNVLKRSASERYNMEVKTIASGLFTTEEFKFYAGFKDAECQHVVIDEILQASPKAIDWCIENVGKCNIIITTDSNQMLAPESETYTLNKFNELKSRPDVITVTVDKTLRARDNQTKEAFEYWYGEAGKDYLIDASSLTSTFNTVTSDNVDYNENDVYICHTKAIEDTLYKQYNLSSRYDITLIPKGRISSRVPKTLNKYPILSQLESERSDSNAYLQVANVATPTRYQGSEVETGRNLYYFVEANSKISSREIYTVITRLWNISNLTIVLIEAHHNEDIKFFNGIPVKKHQYLTLEIGETQKLSKAQITEIVSAHDTNDIYYDKEIVFDKRGHIGYIVEGKQIPQFHKSNKSTAGSLARKDGTMNYGYVNEMYRELEKRNLDHIKSVHSRGKKQSTEYQVDLYSAYQAVIYNTDIPADGFLSLTYNTEMLNFYVYTGEHLTNNSIITEDLKTYVEAMNLGNCEFIFATPKQQSCTLGNILHEKAYRSKESKQDIKGMHWGYFQKRYLEKKEDCYVIEESHRYEIFMASITSTLLLYMLNLQNALHAESVVVDAVHFNDYNDYTVDIVKSVLPEWMDWRIKNNKTQDTIYQTYAELPTEKELKAERDKRRREIEKNAKSMKEEEKKARARERARKAREAKKNNGD